MNINFASINSGSNGNCYYVGTANQAILVDVGLSCKEVCLRLDRLGISANKLKGIFISHEHSDHIKGLEVFVRKNNIPVYISEPTYRHSKLSIDEKLLRFINNKDKIEIGEMSIYCFNKIHDAIDPFSFTVTAGNQNIGIFTDLGGVCSNVLEQFSLCNVVFLESNYDVEMLKNSNYPYYLKNRISGGLGHLSNEYALELFKQHKSSKLTHLLLSHLSKNNNCPDLVYEVFSAHAGNTFIEVASRDKESKMFTVNAAPLEEVSYQAELF